MTPRHYPNPGVSVSQSSSHHLQLDTRVVIKNKYMVQKLISVINCFLLFRHVKLLVIGLSMNNKPGLCLNFTKSLAITWKCIMMHGSCTVTYVLCAHPLGGDTRLLWQHSRKDAMYQSWGSPEAGGSAPCQALSSSL